MSILKSEDLPIYVHSKTLRAMECVIKFMSNFPDELYLVLTDLMQLNSMPSSIIYDLIIIDFSIVLGEIAKVFFIVQINV